MTKQLLISQIMDTTQYIFAINMKKEKESFLFLLLFIIIICARVYYNKAKRKTI